MRTFFAAVAAIFLVAACAALPAGKADPRDPLERFNRSVYRFNAGADKAVFRPAASAWRAVVPRPVRTGLSNFVGNLAYPGTILNDFLQGKVAVGGRDFTRLLINSAVGFGFFDPATRAGFERHDEDFGQTLGKWGVPPGPYLMLPLLGPSTMRDAPAKLVDEYTDGRHYLQNSDLRWGLWATDRLESRASLLDADATIQRAFDPYAFVRNAWLQRREYKVKDGAVEEVPADFGEDAPPDVPPDNGGDPKGVKPP